MRVPIPFCRTSVKKHDYTPCPLGPNSMRGIGPECQRRAPPLPEASRRESGRIGRPCASYLLCDVITAQDAFQAVLPRRDEALFPSRREAQVSARKAFLGCQYAMPDLLTPDRTPPIPRDCRGAGQNLPSAQSRLSQLVASYAKSAPKLSEWMERDIPEGFAVFPLPSTHQCRLLTSNALEHFYQELRQPAGGIIREAPPG
jgi:hypothetical protein